MTTIQQVLEHADLVAFVASRDLRVSGPFYREVLGLRLVEGSEFSHAYDANGTLVRVTLVDRLVPVPYTVLGWSVPDIVATITRLRAAGVVFERYAGLAQDDHDVWIAPGGSRIAWFTDPDGNILSLQQPPVR